MNDVTLEGWPDRSWLLQHWPQLGRIELAMVNGGGIHLITDLGAVHVKKRPRGSVQSEVWILEQLADLGVTATVPVPTLTGALHAMHGNDVIFIYSELPGVALHDYLSPDAVTILGRVGGAAATLHQALAKIDITEAIARGLHVRNRRRGTEGLPLQIIHRDFHAGNVLFEADQVSGYIDFDHLELGPRWVDPCYASLSALARLWEHDQVDQWLAQLEAIVSGYHRVSPVTPAEVEATVELMIGIEEDFLAWFLPDQDEVNTLLTVKMIAHVDRHRDEIAALVRRICSEPSPAVTSSV